MADRQGNPVGGPVPWIWSDLRCGTANVENHSAHPIKVQTNNGGALVEGPMPGIA
jgi:hypothetical protein